ncbi:GtrA family protein [Pseudonocardia nigra]|uniref:GtrA family protein n=1 Tax=Pseudonocardia nigra TaxID=1921578 RepID=UPI001C5EA9F3|nr:GtrA family protein [Pseudonocardia nigra]
MRGRLRLWWRYAAGSVIAGVISQTTFVACYALGTSPLVASVTAFVAGAVPNYLLNRQWAWRRRGRADVRREVAPYAAIAVATALAAAAVTTTADTWVRAAVESRGWQVVLVGAAFLGTYGFLFVLKFVLFDRFVFTGPRSAPPAGT